MINTGEISPEEYDEFRVLSNPTEQVTTESLGEPSSLPVEDKDTLKDNSFCIAASLATNTEDLIAGTNYINQQ